MRMYPPRRAKSFSVILVLLACVHLLPDECDAAEKFWLPSLEWENTSNWLDSIIPKDGYRVVFPQEMFLPAGLPRNHYAMSLAGIDFPWDGGLSLGKHGRIMFQEVDDTTKTATWTRVGPLYWADPANWYSNATNEATPHLERIPCQDDVVVLPEERHTVDVRLPGVSDAKIRTVRVKNDTDFLPSWEWRDLLDQDEFTAGPKRSIQYSGLSSCQSCPCQHQTVGEQLLQEMCVFVSPRCPRQACVNPVNVEGHCCAYCGGRILLSDRTSLSFAKRKVNQLTRGENNLAAYTRRTWDSKVEVLLVHKEGYSTLKIDEATQYIAEILHDEGIGVLAVETGGAELIQSDRIAYALGPLFGVPLVLLLVGLISLPYFGYSTVEVLRDVWNGGISLISTTSSASDARPRRAAWSFNFARFENNAEPDVELADPATEIEEEEAANVASCDEEDADDHGGEFSNPLYRSGRRGRGDIASFAALQRAHQDGDDEGGSIVNLAIEE